MVSQVFGGGVGLLLAGAVLLVLAWLIGVQGHVKLISNYRRHPERYPDPEGLGRWMGWTLAAGGASFALAGTLVLTGLLGGVGTAVWVFATGLALAASGAS